jgi:mannose-6-phosphate isomerase-like protein (cupin superfamily)
MPKLVTNATIVETGADDGKIIREHIGRVNTDDSDVSIAHMRAPAGWSEPGQRPEFTEYTLVLSGTLIVEYEDGELEVNGGQTVVAKPGEWVRYRTPDDEGAAYVAICTPAFSPELAHRDES